MIKFEFAREFYFIIYFALLYVIRNIFQYILLELFLLIFFIGVSLPIVYTHLIYDKVPYYGYEKKEEEAKEKKIKIIIN